MSEVMEGEALNGCRLDAVLSFYSGPVGVSGDGWTAAYAGSTPRNPRVPAAGKIGGQDVVVTAISSVTTGFVRLTLAVPLTPSAPKVDG